MSSTAACLAPDQRSPLHDRDEKSEFLSWLKLWNWYEAEVEHKKSQRKLVQACHENFLSALRMREWRDIHSQLHSLAAEHEWKENQIPATYEAIHRALLAGLLGNIGCKSEDSGHYLGARGMKFLIHPASPLNKKAGKWIAAAEITCAINTSTRPAMAAPAIASTSRRPTALPTRTVVAIAMPSGTMKVAAAVWIVIACAASEGGPT